MIRIIFLFLFSSYLMSQVFSEYSYVGVQSSGMAGSVISHSSSEMGLFQNPASISGFNSNIIISGQANMYSQSYLSYTYSGLIYEMPILGKLGISYQSSSVDWHSNKLSSENSFSIIKGIFLQKDKNSSLALGGRVNFLTWEQSETAGPSGDGQDGFSPYKTSAVGVDFGVIGGLRDRYWVGAYLTNINSPLIGNSSLPQKASISLGFIPIGNVYTNLSMERLLGRNDRQVKLGLKYDLNSILSIMAGAQSNPNRFGIGFEYKMFDRFIFGYSILTHHLFPETHNFEIKFK